MARIIRPSHHILNIRSSLRNIGNVIINWPLRVLKSVFHNTLPIQCGAKKMISDQMLGWARLRSFLVWRWKQLCLGILLAPILAGVVLCATIAIQARANQELYVNQAAETLREIIGPKAVSNLEYSVYVSVRRIHRFFYRAHGSVNARVASWLRQPLRDRSILPDTSDRPADLDPLIANPRLAEEGKWRPMKARTPGLWRTQIRPNPNEADESVDLVAIDLHRLQLKYIPGTEVTENDQLSKIPRGDRSSVVAVFNGGYRNHHDDTGQLKSGILYRPLQDDEGSIVLDRGAVWIGNWTDDDRQKFRNADVRQNLPILLDGGRPGAELLALLKKKRLDFPTIRTALGITADRRWLIFAGGSYLEPLELARALRLAYCPEAVHLDQNHGNVYFDLVKGAEGHLQFAGIEPSLHLIMNQKVFMGSKRDFFYITSLHVEN